MDTRQSNEAVAIRLDNAIAVTTTAPTLATAGIAVRRGERERIRGHLRVAKGASGGNRTLRVKVYGYQSRAFAQDADEKLTEIASSGAWFMIFDSDELTEAADFKRAWLLDGIQDYDRVATAITTNGGADPTLSSWIAFAGVE